MAIFKDGEKMPGVIGLLETWLDYLKRSSKDRPVIVCVVLQASFEGCYSAAPPPKE